MLSKDYSALYAQITNGGEAIGLIDYKTNSGTYRDACKIKKRGAMIEFGVRGLCYLDIDFEFESKHLSRDETEESWFIKHCHEYHVEFVII